MFLAVTCHLHFWQNDRDLLRATAVTQGWNGCRNKSQLRKSTLEKKILPPLLQGFEPATFKSRVQRSNHWAIPADTDIEHDMFHCWHRHRTWHAAIKCQLIIGFQQLWWQHLFRISQNQFFRHHNHSLRNTQLKNYLGLNDKRPDNHSILFLSELLQWLFARHQHPIHSLWHLKTTAKNLEPLNTVARQVWCQNLRTNEKSK